MRPRSLSRRLQRYTTRMLDGARRPSPPDYLRLAGRALAEVLRIDQRLLPYMAEQKRMLENYLWMQQWEAALRRVYGPPDPAVPNPSCFTPAPVDIPQLEKDDKGK